MYVRCSGWSNDELGVQVPGGRSQASVRVCMCRGVGLGMS